MKKKSINSPVLSPKKKRKMSASFIKKARSVMYLAWRFIKELGMTMGSALRLAWMNVKLNYALHAHHEVRFTYRKITGEIRKARGTLSFYPQSKNQNMFYDGQASVKFRKTKEGNQAYFDLDRMSWRSFVCANLLSVETI